MEVVVPTPCIWNAYMDVGSWIGGVGHLDPILSAGTTSLFKGDVIAVQKRFVNQNTDVHVTK